MELNESLEIVKRVLNYKLKITSVSQKDMKIRGILYDAFSFVCGIEDEHHTFWAGLMLGEKDHFSGILLGRNCTFKSDGLGVFNALKNIDDYCRLSLPDKYLIAYDEAYRPSNDDS